MSFDKTFKNKVLKFLGESKFERTWDSAAIKLDGASYSVGHLERFERTFGHIRSRLGTTEPIKVLDMGTATIYHPELKNIFPNANFNFSGQLKEQGWFDINHEKDPIPLPCNSVDVVILLEVIEHYYEDPMFCISEINRVLKTGGTLIITTPNILSLRSTYATLLGYAPYFHAKYESIANARRHVHEYAPYQLQDTLESGGFKPDLWTENVYQKDIPELLEDLEKLGFSSKNRGDTLFCFAEKIGPVINRYPKTTYVVR